jgi:hypothetical protein
LITLEIKKIITVMSNLSYLQDIKDISENSKQRVEYKKTDNDLYLEYWNHIANYYFSRFESENGFRRQYTQTMLPNPKENTFLINISVSRITQELFDTVYNCFPKNSRFIVIRKVNMDLTYNIQTCIEIPSKSFYSTFYFTRHTKNITYNLLISIILVYILYLLIM